MDESLRAPARARTPTPTPTAVAGHGLALRRMGLQDLPFVVAAHRQHFGDGFFARLGPRFLARYYRTFLDGPTAVAVIAECSGEPCGYLTGILRTRQHRRLLLRYHGPGLAVAGCSAMLRHPATGLTFLTTRLPRYVRGLRRALDRRPTIATPEPPNSAGSPDILVGDVAVLTHVVVSEPRRHRGVGTRLVDYFVNEAVNAGCAHAVLVTLADRAGAAAFYEGAGWTRHGSVTTVDGKPLWRYTLPLGDNNTGSGDT